MSTAIPCEFPYIEKRASINGIELSYIEQGQGDPILFLHGIPTSNYLWRNIIPHLSDQGRCIAPDLVGMGHSDQPDIEYTVFDHIFYIEQFIEKLELTNITLVMHAWGSVIGFKYAMRYPEKIKALIFMEAHIRPIIDSDNVALPVQQRAHQLNGIENAKDLINHVLPAGAMRHLSVEEMQHYQAQGDRPQTSKAIRQYLKDLPLDATLTPVAKLISEYSIQLQNCEIPKLMLYALPGFNTSIATVMWAKEHLPNISVVEIEDALHFAQESHPDEVGQAMSRWLQQLSANKR